MFELAFAWAVLTFALGKGTEAVVHAWKGTAPPGHLRRMARIRAREAAAHRKAAKPSEGFRGWARTVWADAWGAAAQRHAERWPDKAAKKMERARARWAWWDHVEEEAGRRWEQRRAERRRSGEDGAPDAEDRQGPDSEDDAPRGEPEDRQGPEGREDRREVPEGESDGRQDRRQAPEGEGEQSSPDPDAPEAPGTQDQAPEPSGGGSPIPPDTPDTTGEPAGQAPDEGVRGPRTPGHPPVSGAAVSDGSDGGDEMAEVMDLAGCTRFTRALHKTYGDSMQTLEEIIAWLHDQNITGGKLHDRFTDILKHTEVVVGLIEGKALPNCEAQLRVRDAIEAAGGTALKKEALINSG